MGKLLLSAEEEAMLQGKAGLATQKAMGILSALGQIYGARRMVPITSVQVAGVSYDNLGEAGLHFLTEMAENGGRVRVPTTLNPAGMDIENWQALGIPADFAAQQIRVIAAFSRMGITPTCSCTPYLAGNVPQLGDSIAWAESSAVCYANSVLGARTNREGGPSALAAALTGRTAEYGFHLEEKRRPTLTIEIQAAPPDVGSATHWFGALGKAIGLHLEADLRRPVPYLRGLAAPGLEELKSFCASLATYGGAALFHLEGVTPEADQWTPPEERIILRSKEIQAALDSLNDAQEDEIDFVSLGCPHLTLAEIGRIAALLEGQQVRREFWITTSRPVKAQADQLGYTSTIEASGAKFATDTCCVVAPIRGRFQAIATDSAKACYYAYSKNKFKTRFKPFEEVVQEALR